MEKDSFLQRNLMNELVKWLNRREAYVIKGPRQSGKTTILHMLKRHLIEELHIPESRIVLLNFEDREILEEFEKNPKAFIKSYLLEPDERYFFLLDEYQKVPDAGQKLKLLWDTFENVKFIATGSSSLELAGAMAKFLVGRVFFFELFQLSWDEFLLSKSPRLANLYTERHKYILDFLSGKGEINLEQDIFLKEFEPLFDEYVTFGGYPEVVKTPDLETKRVILKNIYDTYISKDIIEWLKFTDTTKYHCLIKSLAALTGQMIKYEELSSGCNSYYKEVKHLLSVLNETYIITFLKPYFRNVVTELHKIPKVYFYDFGLRNYMLKNFNSISDRIDKCPIAENFVLLRLINAFRESEIRYWHTASGAEVDFILLSNSNPIPIEVKYQPMTEPNISRSMLNFIATYKPPRALILTKDFWATKKVENTTVAFAPIYYI